MLRAENLIVEVFIDEDDDGTTYAEALMLRNKDRRLLGRGRARLTTNSPNAARIGDEQIAAHALADLVRTLMPNTGPGSPPAPQDTSPVAGDPRFTG
jgi:Rv2632c-like